MKRLLTTAAAGAAVALATIPATPASAREGYLAEVFTTAANFCPRNSMPADGRLLPISQFSALFALMGTMYGGDGRTTFALPKLDPIPAQNGGEIRYCVMTQGIFPSRS